MNYTAYTFIAFDTFLSLPLSLTLSAYVWWICFGTLLPKLCAYVFVSSVCARAMESNGNRVFNYSANILTHCSSVPLSYTSHTRTKKESGRASKRGKNIYTKTSRLWQVQYDIYKSAQLSFAPLFVLSFCLYMLIVSMCMCEFAKAPQSCSFSSISVAPLSLLVYTSK